MDNLEKADVLIKKFEDRIKSPVQKASLAKTKLFTGVDLGTAYIVLSVVDKDGNPVAGAMRFAQVIKDGLVVDYMGAIDILKSLKEEVEEKLGVELGEAGVAYPPGTGKNDRKAISNVAEAVGLHVQVEIDEPTAANRVLSISDGAVVDIGGGTTGIAIFKKGKVVYVADEPTGGTHFSLVISGAYKIPFEEAENAKKDTQRHHELFPIVKPVMQKVTKIIKKHIQNYDVEKIYLVGGTCCFHDIEKVVEEELKIPVIKPVNPFLVTPLGIALCVQETSKKRVKE